MIFRHFRLVKGKSAVHGWLLGLTPVSIVLLIAAGCTQSPQTPAKVALSPSAVKAEYAGNDACKACHAEEFQKHAASRHNTTLHRLSRSLPDRYLPPIGAIPQTDILLKTVGERYQLTIKGEDSDPMPLQFVLGSGKSGLTYVSALEGGQIVEMRKSWFPANHRWYLTPGHESRPVTEVGRLYTKDQAAQCMSCHSVTHPENASIPEERFQGVGCEACHGPAADHIRAIQSGRDESRPKRLSEAKAEEVIELCGRCHRSTFAAGDPGHPEMTNRFQGYGLKLSRCYKESGSRLSCIFCHDPHADAAATPEYYDKACLKCHGEATSKADGVGKRCPVSPKADCVRCHMPSLPVFTTASLPIKMADHYIRIHKDLSR